MSESKQEKSSGLALRGLPTADPFQACVLRLADSPVGDAQRKAVLSWWSDFAAEFTKRRTLSSEVLLQFEHMHLHGRAEVLSANAGIWLPTMGLGTWPDRPPPTMYKPEDFTSLGLNEQPRTLMHQVVRLTAEEEETRKAREEMFGTGVVLHVLTSLDGAALLAGFKEYLLPRIEEPAFRGFPFYIPLLEAKSVAAASSEQLESWLPGVTLYVRESPEDKGLLVISREPLSEVLTAIGCKRQRVPIPTWDIPG